MKTKFNGILTLLLAFVVQMTFAQSTVSGTVSEENGPLPGANVIVKGTTTGTQTDFDGKYTIEASSTDILVFSYVGFTSQEILVGNQSIINANLDLDNALDEVVVTAFGIKQEAKRLTYAAQNIKQEELNVTQNNSVRDALAGKIAGVEVKSQPGSKLGSSGDLYLRGAISLTGRTGAIYVIDGLVTNPDNVDLENIASINVLKGPNATALYGLRGANGVVIMTTKKGRKNSMSVDIYSSTTFDNVTNLMDYQNEYGQGYATSDFGTFDYNAGSPYGAYPDIFAPLDGARYNTFMYADESWGPKFDGQPYAPWYSFFPGSADNPNPYYGQLATWEAQEDNIKDFYDTGLTLKNGFNLRGGGDNFTSRIGYTRQDITGIIPNSTRTKNLISASFDVELNDKFSLGTNINFTNSKTVGDFDDSYGNQVSGSFNNWFGRDVDTQKLRELKNLTTPDGYATSWNWWGPDLYTAGENLGIEDYKKPTFWFNPSYWLDLYRTENRVNTLVGDVHAGYKFNDWITANVLIGRNSFVQNTATYIPYELEFSSAPTLYVDWVNSFSQNEYTFEENTVRPTLDFDRLLTEDIGLNATLGYEFRNRKYTTLENEMSQNGNPAAGDLVGLVIPDLYTFTNSRERVNAGYNELKSNIHSLFGRATLSYKDFLNINGDVNRTYDSRYDIVGIDNDNGVTFGSIGGSLVFSELIDSNALTFGKVFVSQGFVGTEIDEQTLNPAFRLSTQTYNNNPVVYIPGSSVNPDLAPATSSSLEVGTELRFFENRLRFSGTYYNEDRKDEIIGVQLPSSTGVNSRLDNSGLVNREGVELTLGLTPVKTDDFAWDINFNFAKNKTVVEEIVDGLESLNLTQSQFSFVTLTNRVGEEWGQLIGTTIARTDDGTPILDEDGFFTGTPGTSLGTVLPDFNGGVYNSFSYKGLSLAATVAFQKGGQFFSLSESWGSYSGLTEETIGNNDLGNPIRDAVADGGGVHSVGVQADGTPVDVYMDPQAYYNQFFADRIVDNFVHDASYIKLSELSLGYSIPQKLISGFAQSATFGLVARNVWLIATSDDNHHDWDPSQFSQAYGENGQLPSTRSLGFNVKLTF